MARPKNPPDLGVDFSDMLLTNQELTFLAYYASHNFEYLEAYKNSGLAPKDASEAEIALRSKAFVSRPEIKKALKKLNEHLLESSSGAIEVIASDIFQKQMSYSMSDFYDEYGMARPLGEIPKDKQEAILNVKQTVTKDGVVIITYDLIPKLTAYKAYREHKAFLAGAKGGDDAPTQAAQERVNSLIKNSKASGNIVAPHLADKMAEFLPAPDPEVTPIEAYLEEPRPVKRGRPKKQNGEQTNSSK